MRLTDYPLPVRPPLPPDVANAYDRLLAQAAHWEPADPPALAPFHLTIPGA